MTEHEEWRPIPGYEGHYAVSSLGRVRSFKRSSPRILAPTRAGTKLQYLAVCLSMNGVVKSFEMQSLVALAFLGPRPKGQQVRHLDGNPKNNTVTNLRYGTPAENAADRKMHGRDANANKVTCPAGHPYDLANTYIATRKQGAFRLCRACNRAATQRYNQRKVSEVAS
jgi:hypothetical protein